MRHWSTHNCDTLMTWKYNIIPHQNFAGLKPTGKMDKQTKILMNTPRWKQILEQVLKPQKLWGHLCERCGMKDIVGHGSYARKKRWHFLNSPIPIFDSTSGLCIFVPTSRSELLNSFCRYVLQGSRWTKKVLTWKIYKYSRQTSLDKREVDICIC